jgi:quinol monooxygenase YgiN
MIVRVVKLECKTGMEEQLKKLGRDVLVPVNKDAGCLNVYFLEPSPENGNPSFGVVSIWETKDILMRMKESESYQALLQKLSKLVSSSTDEIFEVENR